MSDRRYVYDTNVTISAMLFDTSVPGQAFTRSLDDGTVLVSTALVDELTEVLARNKFDRYLTGEDRDNFLATLIAEAELIEITESVEACRDPKDDRILELAVNGNASFVVTGDRDLLVLNPFRGIPIVTSAELLEVLDETSPESEP